MLSKRGLQFSLSISIGAVLFVILAGLIFYTSNVSVGLSKKLVLENLKSTTYYEAERIQSLMLNTYKPFYGIKGTLDSLLDSDFKNRRFAIDIIYRYLLSDDMGVIAINLAFEPNAFDGLDSQFVGNPFYPSAGRFSVGADKPISSTDSSDANHTLKPISADAEWYTETKKTGKEYFSDVYKVGNSLAVTWSAPIAGTNGKFAGVLAVEISLESVQALVGNIVPFGIGSAYLLDHAGMLIGVDPIRDMHLLGVGLYESGWSGYVERDFINLIQSGKNLAFKKGSSTFQSGWQSFYQMVTIPMPGGKYWAISLQVAEPEMLKDVNWMEKISITWGIMAFSILILIISIMTKKRVVKPIVILSREAEFIASGDLTFVSDLELLSRKDEFGMLAKSFLSMKDNLINMVRKVDESSAHIVLASEQITSGNNDLSQRTDSQAASLEETASSMEEMSATIKSSADHSVKGNLEMQNSMESVNVAAKIISDTATNIEEVYGASSKISEITKIIETIAFQTNILALNAAVEAARAGDQGRGFAVVASEVRNLAQTTQASVKDITYLISNSDEKIKRATETARESQDIFQDIKNRIEIVSKIMQEIADAALEQQSSVSQVNKSVIEMDSALQQNALLVEEQAQASEALLSQAEGLVLAMEFFKIKDK